MNNILEIKNLKKEFEEFTAVNDISFFVEEGGFSQYLDPQDVVKQHCFG